MYSCALATAHGAGLCRQQVAPGTNTVHVRRGKEPLRSYHFFFNLSTLIYKQLKTAHDRVGSWDGECSERISKPTTALPCRPRLLLEHRCRTCSWCHLQFSISTTTPRPPTGQSERTWKPRACQ